MTLTIWATVKAALTPLSLPMAAGTYVAATSAALPDTYLVYNVVDMMPAQRADDIEKERDYLVQVSVYQRSGLAGLPDVIGAMTTGGFIFVAGRQLDYDADTRHFGAAFDFEYLENL